MMMMHVLLFSELGVAFVCSFIDLCSNGGEDPEGPAGREEDLPAGAGGRRRRGEAAGGDRGACLLPMPILVHHHHHHHLALTPISQSLVLFFSS